MGPWVIPAIGAVTSLLGGLFGGKNKSSGDSGGSFFQGQPTQYTGGLSPEDQKYRTFMNDYYMNQMKQPWQVAQPNSGAEDAMKMLYATFGLGDFNSPAMGSAGGSGMTGGLTPQAPVSSGTISRGSIGGPRTIGGNVYVGKRSPMRMGGDEYAV
jgi:hypothetical protein